jgi:hypothetical protein
MWRQPTYNASRSQKAQWLPHALSTQPQPSEFPTGIQVSAYASCGDREVANSTSIARMPLRRHRAARAAQFSV